MNRTEVLERMEPVLNTQVREISHTPKTRVVVTPDMVTFRPGGGARTMEMTMGGVQSLANFVGLPWNIAAKLRPQTFGDASTQLLENKHVYSLVTKDGAITAVARKADYHQVNPERALRSIEHGIPGIEFHRVLLLDATTVSLEVIGDRREPVSQGDLIQAGANIIFSPVGTVDPMVQSYALRLTCTNGATHNTVLREFHWGDGGGEGDDIWQWFRRSSREAYNALDRIVHRYQQMLSTEVPQGERAAILEGLLRQAKISGEAANAIRAMAIENPPTNEYEMVNLITWAQSHLLEKPEQVRRAQQTSADYVNEETHQRVCPVCHTRRN